MLLEHKFPNENNRYFIITRQREETFEGVIRSRKSKDKQYNSQTKMTNNDLQTNTQKHED